jgi:hypothetical protein
MRLRHRDRRSGESLVCEMQKGEASVPVKADALDGGVVVALVYELLDAHADTAHLAAELTRDPRWGAHLDYLCALQRTGREALARIGTAVAT